MHLQLNLFSFLLLVSFSITIAQRSSSDRNAVYFPTDENGGISQLFNNNQSVQSVPSQVSLEKIRGTSIYEMYVDTIISSGISKITIALNKLLSPKLQNYENVVFSPFSITSALSMVLLGSNGNTFKEIINLYSFATGIPDINSKTQILHEQFSRIIGKLIATSGFQLGQDIDGANALFIQTGYPIRPLYKSTAEEFYKSNIINVNFEQEPTAAQSLINNWVSSKTKGKITHILGDAPSTNTKVILVSTLYFKAEWEHYFFDGNTRRRPFFSNGRNTLTNIETDMMANGGDFPYYRDMELGCEILGFPYKGNESTMYVIMPFNSSRDKLLEFQSKLKVLDLERLVSKTVYTGAVILFPKMKIESTISLKESLESLGVKSLFNPNEANLALLSAGSSNSINGSVDNTTKTAATNQADFQTLDDIRQSINQQSADNHYQNPGLYADQVIHKVFIDITETGTEAAAATSVSLARDGSKVTFRVDVPFFFFIRHEETKSVLFWGSVVAPTPNFPRQY